MQFPFRARHFLPGLLLIALGFAQSNTQTPAPPGPGAAAAQPAMVLKVTSRLVVVDVVATDHHGAPVTDLKQDEFMVTEDGHEQKITTFSFMQSRPGLLRAAGPGNGAAPATSPNSNTVDNVPRYSPNGAMNVLLLDSLNTTIRDQKNAHLQMLKLLAKLPADRPIAVFALGSKLRLLQGFTTDPMAVRGAVESFTSKGSPGLNNPTGGAPMNDLAPGTIEVMADLAPQLLAAIQLFQQENVAAQTDLRVQWTIAAMKSLARALGGYPGRKNLIWVSDSFPSAILPDNIDTHGNLNRREYQMDIERMTAMLNDAQIAVYPVDARTLVGNAVFSEMSNTDSQGGYMGRTVTMRGGGDPRSANMNRELNATPEGCRTPAPP
jgi:VWFA-related protein